MVIIKVIWEGKSDTPFVLDHVATFDAIGFIQSGKQNKKFLTFTSDCK